MSRLKKALIELGTIAGIVVALVPEIPMPVAVRGVLVAVCGLLIKEEHAALRDPPPPPPKA